MTVPFNIEWTFWFANKRDERENDNKAKIAEFYIKITPNVYCIFDLLYYFKIIRN